MPSARKNAAGAPKYAAISHQRTDTQTNMGNLKGSGGEGGAPRRSAPGADLCAAVQQLVAAVRRCTPSHGDTAIRRT